MNSSCSKRAHRREKPAHRAVGVLKLERLESGARDGVQPVRALQVAARSAQSLQREREACPLHVEIEAAARAQRAENLGKFLRLPQTLEHQRRPQNAGPVRFDPVTAHPLYNVQLLAELTQRAQQRIEPAGGNQLVATPDRGDHPLPNAPLRADGLDDLQVLVLPHTGATTFDSHEHANVIF